MLHEHGRWQRSCRKNPETQRRMMRMVIDEQTIKNMFLERALGERPRSRRRQTTRTPSAVGQQLCAALPRVRGKEAR